MTCSVSLYNVMYLFVDGEYAVCDLLARADLGYAHGLQVGLAQAEEGVERGHLVRPEERQVLGQVQAQQDALEVGKRPEKGTWRIDS